MGLETASRICSAVHNSNLEGIASDFMRLSSSARVPTWGQLEIVYISETKNANREYKRIVGPRDRLESQRRNLGVDC